MFADRHDMSRLLRAKDLMEIFGYSEATAYRRMSAVRRGHLKKTGEKLKRISLGLYAKYFGLLD